MRRCVRLVLGALGILGAILAVDSDGGREPKAAVGSGSGTRLAVRLVKVEREPTWMFAGWSGRTDFDRHVRSLGITSIRRVFPPLRPGHRLYHLAQAMRMGDWVVLELPPDVDPAGALAELKQSADVEVAELVGKARIMGEALTPNDPYFATHQYPLRNTGVQPPYDPGTAGADAEMEAAWAITTGDSSIIIAIIDTGVDIFHPEFAGRIWENPGEGEEGFDLDTNGYIDDKHGYDFANNDPLPYDDHMHGSHVAGIAASSGNNGIGTAGMNWQCKIMPCKVLDMNGSGFLDDVAEAIYYAPNEGAHVINLSLGGGDNAIEEAAINYAIAAGTVVCAAMGNDNHIIPLYPAAYDSVISVGATNSRDERALGPLCPFDVEGSSFGPWIDVCAAGDVVWSTFPQNKGSYGIYCLTSMASPHVAGLATLILSVRPDYTADSVRRLIRRGAEDQVGLPSEDTPGFDIYHGYGRINGRITLQALVYPFAPIISVPGLQTVADGDTLRFPISAFDSNLTDPTLSSEPLANAGFADFGNGTGEFIFIPAEAQIGTHQVRFFATDGTLSDTGEVTIEVIPGCACPCKGDPKCDSVIADVLDVTNTVAVAFRGGAPVVDPDCPHERSDVDCSGFTDVIDVTKIVGVAFRGADPAVEFCDPCA